MCIRDSIYSLQSSKDSLFIHSFLTNKRLDDTFKISHNLQSSIKAFHDRIPNGLFIFSSLHFSINMKIMTWLYNDITKRRHSNRDRYISLLRPRQTSPTFHPTCYFCDVGWNVGLVCITSKLKISKKRKKSHFMMLDGFSSNISSNIFGKIKEML